MPFHYSQYLRDEKKKGGGPQGGSPGLARVHNRSERRLAGRRRTVPQKAASDRLVWHSNIGAAGAVPKGRQRKPFAKDKGKALTVHFATVEVQPFHFDWSLKDEYFYTRAELAEMGQARFDDAAELRGRGLEAEGGGGTADDLDLGASRRQRKVEDTADLLARALDYEDRDRDVSIRGIEHFVYPDLAQEMIRRKKEVQREVMEFVQSKRPDPQGWRLAQHSRTYSEWARNVATKKGEKYCVNAADELDASTRAPRGYNRVVEGLPGEAPSSFDELEASVRSRRERVRGGTRAAARRSHVLAAQRRRAQVARTEIEELMDSPTLQDTPSKHLEGISEGRKTVMWDVPGTLDDGGESDILKSSSKSQPPGADTAET